MSITTHARSDANESETWFVVFGTTDGNEQKTKIVRKGNPLPRDEVVEWANMALEVNKRYESVDDIYCV